MAPCSTFLDLPRELRDVIYEKYFTSDGGYIFDYNTKRFRRTSGTTIDMHLTQTCRLIANETRGLAFKLDSLHFSTVFPEDKRETFGHFSVLLAILICHKTEILEDAVRAGHFDDAACSDIVATHPQFKEVIGYLRAKYISNLRYHDWKVAHSIGRQFIIDALRALAAQSCYKGTPSPTQYWRYPEKGYGDGMMLWYEPWIIPTMDHVETPQRTLPMAPELEVESWRGYVLDAGYLENPENYFDQQNYRLSAASVAIDYLSSLPLTRRTQLRHITLHEDHTSISWPESHARGLIPFCQQNSQLRIERKVSLWRNVLPGGSAPLFNVVHGFSVALNIIFPGTRRKLDTLQSEDISTKCIGPWIMEALALTDAGMPPDAFTLVFQCDSLPKRSAQVIERLKQDAQFKFVNFSLLSLSSVELYVSDG